MHKNFTLTEEEKKEILQQHKSYKEKLIISEQTETINYNKAIQSFLNKKKIGDNSNQPLVVDGSIGTLPNSKSAQAIAKYQNMIKVFPDDGVWGSNTMDKMPEADKKLFKSCVSEYGDLIDKGLHLFGLD